jgi:hypothetical protein
MTYTLHEVPASGTDRSRFALTSSPTGISTSTAANVARAYLRGVVERQQAAEPIELSKTIALRKVARTIDGGEYVLADCPEIVVSPDARPIRTGKFSRSELEAGALLDDAFFGGPSFREAHDSAIYEAARRVAEQEAMAGQDLIELNRAVQLLILARAGVTTVRPADLPLLRAA